MKIKQKSLKWMSCKKQLPVENQTCLIIPVDENYEYFDYMLSVEYRENKFFWGDAIFYPHTDKKRKVTYPGEAHHWLPF